METYFSQDGNRHSLWDTSGEVDRVEHNLPRLVVVPYAAVLWLSEKERTPNDLRVWIENMIRNDATCQKGDWQLLLDFAVGAAQADPGDKKSSSLAFDVEPLTVTDAEFWAWVELRLDATLGARPAQAVQHSGGGQPQMDPAFWAQLSKTMGSTFGAAVQVHQGQQQQAAATANANVGRRDVYNDWALSALMGYSNVPTERGIPRVWGKFQMSKDWSDNRQEIMEGMKQWARDNGIEIDTSVFFVKLAIEEIVKTKFNPGGPVAVYESAESGISPLMVLPRTTHEIEEEIRREEAADESQGTRTHAEALRLKKTDPRQPPRNWYELKEMCATFAALLWVLFGDQCPLYAQILQLWRVVNHPSIKAVKSTFGKVRCAQITWQILEETRQFFGMRLGPNDFTNGGPGLYPTVELGGLIEDVRRNRPLESVTLPRQWKFQENSFGSNMALGQGSNHNHNAFGGNQHRPQGQDPFSPPVSSGQATKPLQGKGWVPPSPDPRHPFFINFMGKFLQRYGTPYFTKVLIAGNKKVGNLPRYGGNMQGKRDVCYHHLLAKCTNQNCKFHHALGRDVDAMYAEQVCRVLAPGMDYIWRNGASDIDVPSQVGSGSKRRRDG